MNLHRTNIEKMFERNHSVCRTFIQKEKINKEYCTYGHKWECAHWYPHRQRDPLRAPHLALSQFCWRCPPWSDGLWFPYIERQLASPVLNKVWDLCFSIIAWKRHSERSDQAKATRFCVVNVKANVKPSFLMFALILGWKRSPGAADAHN